ncbi:uncharacterized protein LOC114480798 [Gouania willdenowi]|uniref:uncharacterized protein LOC114480798 n=1 Tax=Gouania willdenowi TaxID=441366 RepID=UPI001054E5C7|nr:uncharacterized protein LOC114480798 [Gouania willdenowi]
MAISRFYCLRAFLTFSVVGVLGVLIHQDVEASSETKVIHKRVGDTVELSSPYANNDIISASWKFGERIIASTNFTVKPTQLTKKVFLNPSNFSLTVKALTVHDSGNFIFVPEMNGAQGKSITITLQVHEPPLLRIVNFTMEATNLSCTVLLECNANANHSTIYTWTMRNQTTTGSKLQYFHTPQGEKTNFSCMISNDVHHKSALMVWTCSKDPVNVVLIGSVTGGFLLLVILIGAIFCFRSIRGKRAANECSDQNDISVYASINDAVVRHVHTVYDVLQLDRDVPASSFQEVL